MVWKSDHEILSLAYLQVVLFEKSRQLKTYFAAFLDAKTSLSFLFLVSGCGEKPLLRRIKQAMRFSQKQRCH